MITGDEPDSGGRVADPGDQRLDHRPGIITDAPQGVGGKRALVFQAEVDQADMGAGDPADVDRVPSGSGRQLGTYPGLGRYPVARIAREISKAPR